MFYGHFSAGLLWNYYPVIIREHSFRFESATFNSRAHLSIRECTVFSIRERNFQFESASFNLRVHRFSIQEHVSIREHTKSFLCSLNTLLTLSNPFMFVLSTLYSRFQIHLSLFSQHFTHAFKSIHACTQTYSGSLSELPLRTKPKVCAYGLFLLACKSFFDKPVVPEPDSSWR